MGRRPPWGSEFQSNGAASETPQGLRRRERAARGCGRMRGRIGPAPDRPSPETLPRQRSRRDRSARARAGRSALPPASPSGRPVFALAARRSAWPLAGNQSSSAAAVAETERRRPRLPRAADGAARRRCPAARTARNRVKSSTRKPAGARPRSHIVASSRFSSSCLLPFIQGAAPGRTSRHGRNGAPTIYHPPSQVRGLAGRLVYRRSGPHN